MRIHRTTGWVAFCALFAVVTPAFAQDESVAGTRRLLLEQASEASTAGHHDQALTLGRRAGRIQMTPSLRMFLADEEQALGRTAPALREAALCASETRANSTVNNHDAILAHCQELVASLRGRVGLVIVRTPANATGLTVTIAGEQLDPVLFGTEYAVTPGRVTVTAKYGDRTVAEETIMVEPGNTATVTIPETVTGSAQATVTTTRTERPPPPSAPNESGTPAAGPSRLGPIVVGAVGVAALLAAGAFALVRNDALSGCTVTGDTALCDQPSQTSRAQSDVPTYSILTDVSLAVGGLAIAAAVVWWVATPSPHRERAATIRPILGSDRAGAIVQVTF